MRDECLDNNNMSFLPSLSADNRMKICGKFNYSSSHCGATVGMSHGGYRQGSEFAICIRVALAGGHQKFAGFGCSFESK